MHVLESQQSLRAYRLRLCQYVAHVLHGSLPLRGELDVRLQRRWAIDGYLAARLAGTPSPKKTTLGFSVPPQRGHGGTRKVF